MKNIYQELPLLKVFVISFLFFSTNIFAQASFSAKTDFSVGNFPYSVAAGDLNGDGMPDLVVTNNDDNTISILMNTTVPGAAVSSYSAKTDFSTGFNPYSVAIGDLNGDGKLDIAVANRFGGSVSVLLNTTPIGSLIPSFTNNFDFNANSFTISVAIADINGDGKKDLIVTNFNSANVSVFLNTTVPGATIPTFLDKVDFTTANSPISVSVNDFNGDGKPDLAVACGSAFRVSILLNTTSTGAATPSFSSKTDFLTGDNPSSISTGDLNGDGKPDLAISNNSTGNISILFNTTVPGAAVPSFSSKIDFPTGSTNSTAPIHITMGDLNGDGKLDLAVANNGNGINNFTVFLNITAPGAATPTFLPKIIYTAGTFPYSIFIDDLNGDGKQDLVVVNSGSANVSVFLNTTTMGAPTPLFLAHTDFTTGISPVSEAIGDLNGDGKPDLVIVNSATNTLSVLLNTTTPGSINPGYTAKTDFTTGSQPLFVSIGDLNGDGKSDLVVANYVSNTISVFLNTTSPGASIPSFSAKTDFNTGLGPNSVSVGDINGDGLLDIVSVNQNSNTLSAFLNTTTPGTLVPSFSTKKDFATGNGPSSVSMCDFNGDGNPDLAIANSGSSSISVLLNTTMPGDDSSSFSAKTDFSIGASPNSVSVGDFNGDGKMDLAVSKNGSGVSVFLNSTDAGASVPTFFNKTDFTTGTNPYSVSVCDLNGDGKPDMVVTNYGSGNVSVYLNTTTPGGIVSSFSSKTDFSTGTSPMFASIRDMNGDGKPDLVVTNSGSNNVSILLNNMDLTLPVELTSFSSLVRDLSVVLFWNTATELNSNKFVIERALVNSKIASSTWVSIAIVPGSGTTSSPKKYSYIDNNLQAGKYQYRLKMVDDNGTFKYSSIVEAAIGVPKDYSLSQNYPNPFNPSTKIEYTLPGTGFVQLQIFSVTGQLIKSLVNQNQEAGYYSIDFNGSNLSSGLYIYRLSVNNQNMVRKMMLLK